MAIEYSIGLHAGDVINDWAYIEVNGVDCKIDSFLVQADASHTIWRILRTLTASTNNLPSNFLSGFRSQVPLTCTIHTQHLTIYADILPSPARSAVSHYDEIQNWRQNQIFDNQIHHHKVNYYKFSAACDSRRNANIIQFENFNETFAELKLGANHSQQLNENIGRLNLLFSGRRTADRQRINYFLTEMMRNDYTRTH